MGLTIGTRLGSYEVLEQIGSGGMGEVYRALDHSLGREVAIKVLPEALAASPDHLARFGREARLLASLDHSHIGAIYGLAEGSVPCLILELVTGETLAARLQRGPLPLAEAIGIAIHIAAALGAAHEKGIIHRDLKPANIKIKPDGTVKVLDFGLAKSVEGSVPSAATTLSRSPTLDLGTTRAGEVLGTPAYMSPEQARGRPVDWRTDVWALGCVLYEMLTGTSPFAGETFSDTIAMVLTSEPDWDELPGTVPPFVRDCLVRCLEKESSRRTLDAREIGRILEESLETGGRPAGVASAGRAARPQPHLVQITFGDGIDGHPAWSPDGREIVYSGEAGRVRKLIRKRATTDEGVAVTRGDHDDLHPAWSPDGARILFTRAREPGRRLEPADVFGQYLDGDIWSLDLASGKESRLVERAANPVLSPDGGTIAFDASWAGPRRIWLADANGRNPRQASSDVSEAVTHVRPRWSPDGRRIVFQNIEQTKFDLRSVDLASGHMEWLTHDLYQDVNPVWSPSGRWVYFSSYRSGGLNVWRVPVRGDGSPGGPPEQVTTGAGQDVEIAISPDGRRLAFTTLRQNADIWRLPVAPGSGRPTGKAEPVIGTSREESRGAWSPDGSAIAFNSDRDGAMNIWILPAAGSPLVQLTRGEGGDYQPCWSPDARTIAFFSSRGGSPGIWTVGIGDGRLSRLSRAGGIEINPFYSPDGGRIAYQSDRAGRLEVWVMRADGSDPRPVTSVGVGGHITRWTADGASILFRCPSLGRVMRAGVDGGEPEPLAEVAGGAHISLSPDGSRIMDVVAHKTLWVSPLAGGVPERVFEFEDPEVRIDYPVWSPDGRFVLFDRFRPQGGDIWVMDEFE